MFREKNPIEMLKKIEIMMKRKHSQYVKMFRLCFKRELVKALLIDPGHKTNELQCAVGRQDRTILMAKQIVGSLPTIIKRLLAFLISSDLLSECFMVHVD